MNQTSWKTKLSLFIDRIEPIRFYLFRFVRVFLLFYLTAKAVDLSVPYIPSSDPDAFNYNPTTYHGMGALSLLLVFLFLSGLFVLYDPTARRRFCKNPPKEKTLFSEWLHVFQTYEFWCEIAGLALLPLIFGTDMFRHPLYIFFGREDFGKIEAYLLYLLTVLPIMALIELFMRVRTRRFWRGLSPTKEKELRFDGLKLLLLSLMVLFAGGALLSMVLLLGATAIALFVLVLPAALPAIATIVLLIFLFFHIRAFRIRKKFLHKLKKLCKEENFELSAIKNPYRSLLFQKNNDFHFTVKAYGKTYACKMLAGIFKNAPMMILDEEMAYFKFAVHFGKHEIVLFRKRFYYSFDAENADKKLLIVSPVPNEMKAVDTRVAFTSENTTFVTESKHFRRLDNASFLYGMTVFSAGGFLNALTRNCLDRSTDD